MPVDEDNESDTTINIRRSRDRRKIKHDYDLPTIVQPIWKLD